MTKKKIAIAIAAAALAGTCAIGGTLAWLTSTTSKVENVFTMGNVSITLDEADVDNPDNRWSATPEDPTQSYRLTPGTVTAKDPTVTVNGTSEPCYVFVAVKDTLTDDENFTLVNSKLGTDWVKVDGAEIADGYTLYRYNGIVSPSGEAKKFVLFDGINVADGVTEDDFNEDATIDIKAFAIQSANLGDDDTPAVDAAIEEAEKAFATIA